MVRVGQKSACSNTFGRVDSQGRRQDFSPRGGIENARGGKDFNVLNIPVTSQPPYLLR